MGFDIKVDLDKPGIDDFRLARKINRQTAFSHDQEKLYYFVREGFQETNISEGFCHEIQLTSEMLNGRCRLDGIRHMELSMGDIVTIRNDPKNYLNCMDFIF